MFCAASGWIFRLQIPGIKPTGYPHGAKLSRAHVSPGLWSTGNGLRLRNWAVEWSGSAALTIPDQNSVRGTSNVACNPNSEFIP